MHRPSINQYTPEGRRKIHDMLCKEGYADVLFELGNRMSPLQSVEYCDNRLARFVASKGKCEITGKLLPVNEVHCHHFLPRHLGGTDQYSNLRIVHVDVHRLIHALLRKVFNFTCEKQVVIRNHVLIKSTAGVQVPIFPLLRYKKYI